MTKLPKRIATKDGGYHWTRSMTLEAGVEARLIEISREGKAEEPRPDICRMVSV